MQIGEVKSAEIDSKLPWNLTGIQLVADEEYQLNAEGKWIDRTIVYTPAGGPSPVWYLRLFEPFRRLPGVNWFTLCGAVNQDKATRFAIGNGVRYKAPTTGELTCFANDVPGFYSNNDGAVRLTVKRIG